MTLNTDILGIIASYLTDEDLKAFSLEAVVCEPIALKERVKRVLNQAMKELEQLAQLDPQEAPRSLMSPLDAYKKLFFFLNQELPEELEDFNAFKNIDVKTQLRQVAQAFTTHNVAKEVLELKQKLFRQISDASPRNRISWESIDRSSKELQERMVGQAYVALLQGSPNPEKFKSLLVSLAANYGHLGVLDALLSDPTTMDPIFIQPAFTEAVTDNDVEVVSRLLKGCPISEESKDTALVHAAGNRHKEIVKAILANGAVISPQSWMEAILSVASYGSEELIQTLLEHNTIPSAYRNEAITRIVRAAGSLGHLNVLQFLLKQQLVSKENKKEIFMYAATHGDLPLVQTLLANESIPANIQARAAFEAEKRRHRDIANLLRQESFFDIACVVS
jgi:hypothetical protein